MSSDLAIYASTVATAVQLATGPRTAEASRQAASVAVVALDFATPEARAALAAELDHARQLGDAANQFPAVPWPLWDDDRIFRLLKSAKLDQHANQVLRGMTVRQLVEMSPATLLALLGSPHRVITIPPWLGAAVTGVVLGTGLVLFFRERRPWPA